MGVLMHCEGSFGFILDRWVRFCTSREVVVEAQYMGVCLRTEQTLP